MVVGPWFHVGCRRGHLHRYTYNLQPMTLTLAECSGNEWSRRDEEDTGKVQEVDMRDTSDTREWRAAEDTWFENCWYSIHFFHKVLSNVVAVLFHSFLKSN